MGMLRTINHPGVEIQEVDMSGSTEQVGGTTTLVMGFFPQGESGKPVNPTSMAALKSYFGTPENEAERYAYYACKTVFDNGGRLVASRIPYNNNSQWLTPAVKYDIQEWSTKHVKTFDGDSTVSHVRNSQTAKYDAENLDSATDPAKSDFFYRGNNDNAIGIYWQEILVDREWGGNPGTVNTLAISSALHPSTPASMYEYYVLSFNPFTVETYYDNDAQTATTEVSEYSETGFILDGEYGTYSEMLAEASEADEGFNARVDDGFEVAIPGMYLSGGYADGTCFKKVFIVEDELSCVANETEMRALTNTFKSYDCDKVLFVGELETNPDTGDKSPLNPPRDAVAEYNQLPTVARVVTETDEFDGQVIESIHYVIEYTSASYGSPTVTAEIGDGWTVKVIGEYDGATLTNYMPSTAEPDPGTEEGYVKVEWDSDGSDDGYWIYDRTHEEWRRFWDFHGQPDLQWSPTPSAKYNWFRFSTTDTGSNFNTPGEITVDANGYVYTNESGVGPEGEPVTSKIYASIDDGSLRLQSFDVNGDMVRDLVVEPVYHSKNIDTDMDLTFLTQENSRYFEIKKTKFAEWTSNVTTIGPADPGYSGPYFYAETLEEKSDFYYDPTFSSPVTASVDSYGTYGIEQKIAIKSYYKSGDGTMYPEVEPTDYLELRIWDTDRIKSIEDLTAAKSEYFDIIHREYCGRQVSDVSQIANQSFKAVPLTSDVTTGYDSGSVVTSENISIPACEKGDYDENNYPAVADMNPFGTGWMKVLTKVKNGIPVDFDINDFYQLVSPYKRIQDIAEAASEKYQWIRWRTPSTSETTTEKGILLSRTLGCEVEDVPVQLSEVENLVTIMPDPDFNGYVPLEEFQDYRDGAKKPAVNEIVVANVTEQKFVADPFNNSMGGEGDSDEVLGIVPVLMGGFQSLPRQSRIELPEGITNGRIFNAVESIIRGSSIENDPAPAADHVDVSKVTLNPEGFVRTLGASADYDAFEQTYSNQLLGTIPAIDLNGNYKPNGAKVNYVTLAVCQLSLSKVNDNKVAVTVLETFTGSLDPAAKSDDGKKSMFIDDVVNSEDSGSSYVRVFSNYQTTLNGVQNITESMRETVVAATNDTKATLTVPASPGSKMWWTNSKPSQSLGFTDEQTKKYISYATIVATVENTFDTLSNVDELDLDLVVDAGLSTIANRIKRIVDEDPEKTKALYDVFWENITDVGMVSGWKSMCAKMTTFCQTTRKDCIALLDAPRNLCVKDNVKLATPGGKYSVDYDILPKFNYLGSMNSSYAVGYCDWLMAVDDFSSKNVWLPPSISGEGAIIFTDYNSNYWMAPAGQSRGNVMWAVDVAFNPNAQQQDSIYSKGWNYAISSSGSIMVWGQKTMLNSTSSFNRINIRRLFCRLERLTRKNSKWVIFEINNERTRNIYKDRIDPIFANVKAMGGIFDYQIICDSRNNTPAVVQSNEFRAAFLVKPEHVAEYILLTFFNLNQDMAFEEVYSQL